MDRRMNGRTDGQKISPFYFVPYHDHCPKNSGFLVCGTIGHCPLQGLCPKSICMWRSYRLLFPMGLLPKKQLYVYI